MHTFLTRLAGFRENERGAVLVEYALLLVLIVVVCMLALETLGDQASATISKVGGSIAGAGN